MSTSYWSAAARRQMPGAWSAWSAWSAWERSGPSKPYNQGKRIVTAFGMLALVIVCFFTGASAATAATVPTANLPGSASDNPGSCARATHISSASDSSVLACGGECPGFCPCPVSELKDGDTPISKA